MKAIKTWIVISDAARARILLHEGVGHGLSQVTGHDFREPCKTAQEIMADRPGRAFDSHGQGRHAMEPSSDPVREEKKQFAQNIADFLDEQAHANAFDRLVIVAPPKTLGDLRTAFSKEIAGMVYAELSKDLTKIPNDEIEKHLEDTLAT